MSYFTDKVSETNPYGYEVYPCADGSEVMFSRDDRVLFHRVTPTSMPLTTDPDSVLDEVLVSLQQAQREIDRLNRLNQKRSQRQRKKSTVPL